MKAYSGNAEIIICTEKGYLERMARLLIWSIREFGGKFSNIPIYSYQPRKGHEVSGETSRFFENYEVELVDICLNQEYPHYPLANKVFACAHREQNTTADALIFLDTDIFFLNDPTDIIDFEGHDTILRPVDYKIVGTDGPGDSTYPFWEKMYRVLKIQEPRMVVTTGDRKRIYEYYNSGHLVTKTSNGLFRNWLENFHSIMKTGLQPDNGIFFIEQITFAATVTKMRLLVKQADDMYNLPIFFILNDQDVTKQIEKYGNAKTIHYHKKFKNVYGHNPLQEFLNGSVNGKLINSKLEEYEVLKRESNVKILKHILYKFYSNFLKHQ